MKKLFFLVMLCSSFLIGGCLKNQSALITSDSTTDDNGSHVYIHPEVVGGQQGTHTPVPLVQNIRRKTIPKVSENYVNEHGLSRVVISGNRKLRDVKIELGYEGYPSFSDIPADSDGTKTLWLPKGTHMVNAHSKKGPAAVQNGRIVFYLWLNGVKLTHVAPRSVGMGGMFYFRVHADGSISPCTPNSGCY